MKHCEPQRAILRCMSERLFAAVNERSCPADLEVATPAVEGRAWDKLNGLLSLARSFCWKTAHSG